MEIILIIGAVLVLFILFFFLIEYPYYLVSFIVFTVLYKINIETPLPIDTRGILVILIFTRLCIFDKENLKKIQTELLENRLFQLIVIFLILGFFVTVITNGRIKFSALRDIAISLVSISLGFILFTNEIGRKSILIGVLITGIFSLVDLLYTYAFYNSLYIRRVIDLVLHSEEQELGNHGKFGFMIALALIVSIYSYKKGYFLKVLNLVFIFIFTLGVIFSTSRSVLAALMLIVPLIMYLERSSKFDFFKILRISLASIFFIFTLFTVYEWVIKSLNFELEFVELFKWRLIEEPALHLGLISRASVSASIQDNQSIEFREDKTAHDLLTFYNFNIPQKLIGLGNDSYIDEVAQGRFLKSGRKQVLNAHNGYMIILIEKGIIGLLIFLIFLSNIVFKTFKMENGINLFAYLFLFTCIYAFGVNDVLATPFIFILIGAALSNLVYGSEIETS